MNPIESLLSEIERSASTLPLTDQTGRAITKMLGILVNIEAGRMDIEYFRAVNEIKPGTFTPEQFAEARKAVVDNLKAFTPEEENNA